MNILYVLVPLALVLAGAGVWAFYWSVRTGQYDDTDTPAIRVLMEDELSAPPQAEPSKNGKTRRT
jgi:cbb3-type cytochrome oxidase maturation protein